MSQHNVATELQLGEFPAPGASPVKLMKHTGQYALMAYGTTVPTDGTAGYSVGCIFIHTDGGAGTTFYVNEGSVTSCDFNRIEAGNIALSDDEVLYLGDDYDVGISWDGSALNVIPLTDNTGQVIFGNGTKDIDVKVILGAATDFALFDVSAGNLTFDNAEIRMGDSDPIEFGDAADASIQFDGADTLFDNTGTLQFQWGGVGGLEIDDGAISGFAAAADTAGKGIFVETQDGGADGGSASTGQAGGALSIKCGDGSAAVTTGAVGGAGGACTLQAGAGAAGDGAGNGGAGGALNLTAGAGAADGGSGADGVGGDVILTPGAAGGSGARAGVVSIPDGKIGYIGAIAMPGTTEGTNWLGIDVGTPPTGTIATGIAVYTSDGDNLSFLHADGTTDDLGS